MLAIMTESNRRPRGPSQHHAAPQDIPNDAPADRAREEFARRLQRHMALKGLSQSDLAREATKQLPGTKKVGKDSVSQYISAPWRSRILRNCRLWPRRSA